MVQQPSTGVIMPTARRRIQVMLEGDTIDAVERYAAATNQSLSSVCGAILDIQAPALFKLAAVMEASQSLSERARSDLEASLTSGVHQSQAAADEMMAMVSELLEQAKSAPRPTAPPAGQRRGRARRVGAVS